MAEFLSIISIGSYVLAGVFLVLSIILWVKLGIPKIMGDLSGKTARKSIEKIRKNNEKTGLLYENRAEPKAQGLETELLDGEATGLLDEKDGTVLLSRKLTMLDEIIMIHTDEVIE